MIDYCVPHEYASGWVGKPKTLHSYVNEGYMVFESLVHPFGQAKAPHCITRLSLSNCAQQESKVLILVPRVATGNPLKRSEVLSTISKAHWMPLKLTTFRLKTLDEEGRCNHVLKSINFQSCQISKSGPKKGVNSWKMFAEDSKVLRCHASWFKKAMCW